MVCFDFDKAMRVYLGGDPTSGAIQIGKRDERLDAEFGSDAVEIKQVLDLVLDLVVNYTKRGFSARDQSIENWLANKLPSASDLCRKKMATHAIYCHTH